MDFEDFKAERKKKRSKKPEVDGELDDTVEKH